MKPDVTLMIDGDLALRPLIPDDVTQPYVDGLNRREVNAFLQGPSASRQTLESVCAFVRANMDDPAAILFGIFDEGRHCGNVRLHDITGAAAWMGIAIFEPGRWGKGMGSLSIRSVSEYGFTSMGLAKIRAGIDLANAKSIAAFERAGFRRADGDVGERPANSGVWICP